MANLTRYKQKIFANNSNQVGVFGTGTDKVASKNVETLQSADYEDGWSSAIVTNKNYPVWQERDGVDYGFSYQLAYLLQKGVPEWLSTETYYTNDFCKSGNKIYYSLQDNNINQNPTTATTYWAEGTGANIDLSNLSATGQGVIDGQWVKSTLMICEDVAWTTNTPEATYSLSNYLPNDSYDYEVLIDASCITGTTSGRWVAVELQTDILSSDNMNVCYAITRTSSNMGARSNAIIPVGTGRYIKQYSTTSTTANGTYTIRALAYRRMGTNQ